MRRQPVAHVTLNYVCKKLAIIKAHALGWASVDFYAIRAEKKTVCCLHAAKLLRSDVMMKGGASDEVTEVKERRGVEPKLSKG